MRAWRWIGVAGLVCGCACTQAPPETPEPIFFADVESISLGYETRHAIPVAAASSKTFRVQVPANGSLRFAIATAEPDEAVMFRALVDGNPVFEKTLAKEDGDHWWDQPRVDLEPWSGESVDITFETDGRALWGSPVIETEDAPPFGPNLIVISIDCLRADHVGAYGYEKPTTPAIDSFAEDAVVFENASSTSSWTIPAHMSMFTGLPPLMHGVSDSPDDYWAGRAKTLAPTVPYLAELLARRGYNTAGVVSSVPMSPRYGFNRGFRVYRVHAAKVEEVVDSAIDLVARSGERPFFLFVHFIDPHWPYLPMVEFRSYAEEFIARFGERPEDISELIARHNGKALGARPEDAEDVRTLYDAALAYVDRELGRLFAELTERGLYEDAFILLIGDHGEAFYDHETFGHAKTLYRELTHVPLIVKWPGEASKGREDTPRQPGRRVPYRPRGRRYHASPNGRHEPETTSGNARPRSGCIVGGPLSPRNDACGSPGRFEVHRLLAVVAGGEAFARQSPARGALRSRARSDGERELARRAPPGGRAGAVPGALGRLHRDREGLPLRARG